MFGQGYAPDPADGAYDTMLDTYSAKEGMPKLIRYFAFSAP